MKAERIKRLEQLMKRLGALEKEVRSCLREELEAVRKSLRGREGEIGVYLEYAGPRVLLDGKVFDEIVVIPDKTYYVWLKKDGVHFERKESRREPRYKSWFVTDKIAPVKRYVRSLDLERMCEVIWRLLYHLKDKEK